MTEPRIYFTPNFTEFNKLTDYLSANSYFYKISDFPKGRIVEIFSNRTRNNDSFLWNAVVRTDNQEKKDGLLNIFGTLAEDEKRIFEKNLTASDIIYKLRKIKINKK